MSNVFILLGCFGFLLMLALVAGLVIILRWLSYRETLALAEKGLVRPPRPAGGGRTALVWGIIMTAIGLALTLGLWPLGFIGFGPSQFPLGFGPWMLIGLVPLFFGLALILIYILTHKEEPPAAEPPVVEPPAIEQSAEIFPVPDESEL